LLFPQRTIYIAPLVVGHLSNIMDERRKLIYKMKKGMQKLEEEKKLK